MKVKIIFITAFLLIPIFLLSQEKTDSIKIHNLSLDEAKQFAIENNYQNKNSKIDIEIAKKQIWETTAIGLPQINASGEYSNMIQIPTQMLPGEFFGAPGSYIPVQFGQQHNLSGTITATQLIFSGEYIVGLQASKIFLEISKQSYSKSTKSIKETVTKSYYLALIAEESKKILEETGKNFESLLNKIEQSYKLGFVEDIDVDQLRLTKQNNDNTLITINNQIELSKRLLKYQLGISFKDSLILSDSLDIFVEKLDFSDIVTKEFDLESNIDYKLMQTQEAVAELNLKREKSLYLPQLSAFFTHSQNAYNNDFADLTSEWFPSTIFGLNLNIPIFSSGLKNSKVKQRKLKLEQTKNQKEQLEQSLGLQADQYRKEFINAKNKFENEKSNMTLAKRINDKTEIKYNNGVSSVNDLMIVQNQYLSSLNNYYLALSTLLETRATLEYILLEN
ncbi:MAG: TolC family protein [Bacteroidales bacterium]|nr:TolC family protein [Bacteroidales bacterium]MBN2756916.1 TolC family protein [Bacteroidales bacterium]